MSVSEDTSAYLAVLDFQAIFASMPTAYLVMTPDFVIADANDAYLNLVSRKRRDLIGKPVFEAFPPSPESLNEDGSNAIETSFKRARDTGKPDPMPMIKYDILDPATGQNVERFWSLISCPIMSKDGEPILVLQRVEDVTDYVIERATNNEQFELGEQWKRRAEVVEADLFARAQELRTMQEVNDVTVRRLASLARVALELSKAETIEDLERIVVDQGIAVLGADGGAIISPHEDGGWRATLPSLGENVEILYGKVPYDSPLPAPHVARTGERVLLPTEKSGLEFDDCMAAIYTDTGRSGWAFFPLMVGENCLGSLAMAWVDEHHFRPDELDLLSGFAAQCAQTLDRIRYTMAQREATLSVQQMSETLQRSLLTKPPTPDSLRIAVRYQPAAQEAQIGGDWYDAFLTSSKDTFLVVGDVSGHDRAAAATMGQIRNLLRGLAYDSDDSPAVLLSRLDIALRGLELESLATAVLARIEQHEDGTRRLRWSSAGHLPPLLRQPDGTVVVLDSDLDLLLGVDPSVQRTERVVELTPGSTILLYTDGLVERRNAMLDDGIAALAEAFASESSRDPEVICDTLLNSVGGLGNYDDIALLVLRVTDEYDAQLVTESLTLPADPRAVRQARQMMARLCKAAGIDDEMQDTAVLLVSEVVTNAVMHARSEARIKVTIGPEGIVVEVGDNDTSLPMLRPPNEEATDGRGVGLLAVASSKWGVRVEPQGKVVWFAVSFR